MRSTVLRAEDADPQAFTIPPTEATAHLHPEIEPPSSARAGRTHELSGPRGWVKVKNRQTRDIVFGAIIGSIDHPKVVIAGVPDAPGQLVIVGPHSHPCPQPGRGFLGLDPATPNATASVAHHHRGQPATSEVETRLPSLSTLGEAPGSS